MSEFAPVEPNRLQRCTNSYQRTGGTCITNVDSTVFQFRLSATDLGTVKAVIDLATSQNDVYLNFTTALVSDVSFMPNLVNITSLTINWSPASEDIYWGLNSTFTGVISFQRLLKLPHLSLKICSSITAELSACRSKTTNWWYPQVPWRKKDHGWVGIQFRRHTADQAAWEQSRTQLVIT